MRTRNAGGPQPTQQPAVKSTAARTGRKRRASNLPEAPQLEASQSPQGSPTARPAPSQCKKRRTNRAQQQSDDPPTDHPRFDSADDTIAAAQDGANARHVHFTQHAHARDDDTATALATTPYPRAVDRRITLSPAMLSHNTPAPSGANPLRKSMSALTDSPHAAVSVDVNVLSLNEDIERRKNEMKSRSTERDVQRRGYATSSVDNDMMLYNGHEEPAYRSFSSASPSKQLIARRADSPLDHVNATEVATQTAPNASQGTKMEQERAAFQLTIQRLYRETSDAKARNEILSVEIMQLGFGNQETPPDGIIKSIRDTFADVRKRLQLVLSDTELPVAASNAELLEVLLKRHFALEEHAARQIQLLAVRDLVQHELRQESEGLRDRMASDKLQIERLEHEKAELEQQVTEDHRYMTEQEDSLASIAKAHDCVKEAVQHKDQHLTLLGEDNAMLQQDNADLKRDNTSFEADLKEIGEVLDQYKESEQKLKSLISDLEKDFAAKLQQQRQLHQEEVDRLTRLLTETSNRCDVAASDINVKQLNIAELEAKLEQASGRADEMTEQLHVLRQTEAREREAKLDAEKEIDVQLAHVEDLEEAAKIALEDHNQLHRDIALLQEVNDRNTSQREDAEAELDRRTIDNEGLRAKLEKQGRDANELRQKLFEAQLSSEQYEALMKERDANIMALERQLATQETRMRDTLAKMDEHASEDEARQVELQKALADAQHQIEEASAQHSDMQSSSESRAADLIEQIKGLSDQLETSASQVTRLERMTRSDALEHATVIQRRDAEIAKLNTELNIGTSFIAELHKTIQGLELRVEQEAEAMLDLEARKGDEIADLRLEMGKKQKELEEVVATAKEYERVSTGLIAAKDDELVTVEGALVASQRLSATFQVEKTKMAELLKTYVVNIEHAFEAQRVEFEVAREGAVKQETLLKAQGQRVLEEMEALQAPGGVVQTIQHIAVVST